MCDAILCGDNTFRRSNFWVADAIQFTRSAVATIGIKKFTYGNVSHEIQVCDPSPLPPRTDSLSHPPPSLSLLPLSHAIGMYKFPAAIVHHGSYSVEDDESW